MEEGLHCVVVGVNFSLVLFTTTLSWFMRVVRVTWRASRVHQVRSFTSSGVLRANHEKEHSTGGLATHSDGVNALAASSLSCSVPGVMSIP